MSHVRIIGGGVAGYSLVRELAAAGYTGQVSLHDAQGLPYDRPPLSKSLAVEPFAPHAWYQQHSVQLVQEQVQQAQVPAQPGDWLVLATGTVPKPLAVPGAHHARTLHTAADATALAAQLEAGMFGARVLVIGAGLVGAEFASTARMFGAQTTLVSTSEAPLASVFGEPMARQLHAEHARHGIRTLVGAVTELGAGYGVVNGEKIEADIIVAAIGATPQLSLAASLGLQTGQGVLVDDSQRTSQHQVLAIGDAAERSGQPWLPHWEAAMEDAAVAASTILGRSAPARQVPWFWSDRHESHVEVAGRFAQAVRTVARLDRRGRISVLFGLDAAGRLAAASMVDGGLMSKAVRKLIAADAVVPDDVLQDASIGPKQLARTAQ